MDKLKLKATNSAASQGHTLGQWFGHPSWPAAAATCIYCDAGISLALKNRSITGEATYSTSAQVQDHMSPKEKARRDGELAPKTTADGRMLNTYG